MGNQWTYLSHVPNALYIILASACMTAIILNNFVVVLYLVIILTPEMDFFQEIIKNY